MFRRRRERRREQRRELEAWQQERDAFESRVVERFGRRLARHGLHLDEGAAVLPVGEFTVLFEGAIDAAPSWFGDGDGLSHEVWLVWERPTGLVEVTTSFDLDGLEDLAATEAAAMAAFERALGPLLA